MATAPPKLMTAEAFYDFCHRPENRDRHFELEQGQIVEIPQGESVDMPLPGERHGVVCSNTSRTLGNFTFRRKKGYVCTNDVGLILERDPDTVRGANVTLYDELRRYDELNLRYNERLPTLLVEVLSPHDRVGKMMRRIAQFLDKGVPLVWLIDPEARNITVYRRDKSPVVVEENEELTGYDVLPDLHIKAAELFLMPGE